MSKTRAVRLSRETDLLKLVAITSMLIDHLGAALFPGVSSMRIVGRLAFPIFCYTLAAGCCYTRSMRSYVLRLFLTGVVSQPIYCLAMGHTNMLMDRLTFANPLLDALKWYFYSLRTCNILFALTLGALVIWTLKEKKYVLTALLAFFIYWIDGRGYLAMSYGLNGIVLMLLFWAFIDKPLASFVWVGGFMLLWAGSGYSIVFYDLHFGIQLYAMLALPLIYLPMDRHFKMPRSVFYLFYPLHLLLIFFLKQMG
ncbi:MAG: TraX family protein [Eubacteriales bacterium]|nr:TraX family protein [Eubacteriales bacterium]